MKVLHAAETIRGGVATVLRQLLASTTPFAVDQMCLVPADQSEELGNRPCILTFPRSGRDMRSLASFSLHFFFAVWRFRPDIVHLHSTFAGCLGRIILLFMWPIHRPKIIYCPHGWCFLMKNTGSGKNFLYAAVERALAMLCDRIVCVSRYEASEAVRHGIPDRRIEIVLNGVEPPGAGMAPNPYDPQKINILFVGRFDYQKGFDVLKEAMRILQQSSSFHLTAVGAPVLSNSMPEERENITYTGWMKPLEIGRYFRYADILVMPSRWEAFGLVAAEAQSYGLPVLASDCSSLSEIVSDGVTGHLFPSGCSSSLAMLIRRFTVEHWRSMRAAALKNYERNFCSEKMCKAITDLYARVNSAQPE